MIKPGLHELGDENFRKTFYGHPIAEPSRTLSVIQVSHQCGSYNPQLGDSRRILLEELKHAEDDCSVHLKGASIAH